MLVSQPLNIVVSASLFVLCLRLYETPVAGKVWWPQILCAPWCLQGDIETPAHTTLRASRSGLTHHRIVPLTREYSCLSCAHQFYVYHLCEAPARQKYGGLGLWVSKYRYGPSPCQLPDLERQPPLNRQEEQHRSSAHIFSQFFTMSPRNSGAGARYSHKIELGFFCRLAACAYAKVQACHPFRQSDPLTQLFTLRNGASHPLSHCASVCENRY
jgi:hypothetical protein